MSTSEDAPLKAEAFEHWAAPSPPTPAERRGWGIALFAAALLHVVVPLALVAYYRLWPGSFPAAEEIPVEIVVEKPPPKPEPREEKPQPPSPPQQDDEKPAYDAPAASTHDKVNRESPNDKTKAVASEAQPPPVAGAPRASQAQTSAAPSNEPQKPETAAPAHEMNPSPEGEQLADLNPDSSEASAQAAAQAAPAPPTPKAPVGAPLPTIEELPQYQFARAVKDSPVAGGNAESRYFTIVFGMIKSHLIEPQGLRNAPPNREGAIVFGVDETGNLIGRKMVISSGSPSLDMAMMAAIAAAAPYPAPPNWQPRTMRVTYGGRPAP